MKYISCLLLLIIFIPFLAEAQVSFSPSLKVAIENAMVKNLPIQNQLLEVEKLHIEGKSIKNTYIPKIEASALYTYFDSGLTIDVPTASLPITGTPLFEGKTTLDNYGNVFYGGIMAKMVLFSGFQIPNGAKAIAHKAQGTTYLMEGEKDKIIQKVVSSFDKLFLIKASEQLIADSEKRLNKEKERIKKAIANGLAIPYDRDKIELAYLELQSKKTELRGNKKLLYRQITYLTGYNQAETDKVTYQLEPYIIFDENLSIKNKQELKALESFKQAYEYLLKKEKGTFLPTVGAFGGVSYTSLFNAGASLPISSLDTNLSTRLNEFTLYPNWMAGLALKWEIFSGFERKHKIETAKINITQMENKIKDSQEQLGMLLQQQLSNYNLMLEKLDIAVQQEKIAKNNLNLTIKQYREGLISISERLEAENDLYKAGQNKVNTIIQQRKEAIETIAVTGKIADLLTSKTAVE